MRVDHAEVEFACDHEDLRSDRLDACEAPGVALGELEQVADSFQKSVGLACLRTGHDTLQMRADHSVYILHRINLEALHASAPMFQHGAHDIDLFALEDFARLILLDPGAGRALDGHHGDQRIQIGGGFGFKLGDVLEQGRKEDHGLCRPATAVSPACLAESIDYAVMRSTSHVSVVSANMGGSEVRSSDSWWHIPPKNVPGNALRGDVFAFGKHDNYVPAEGRQVGVEGLSDEIPDAVLLSRRQCT